MENNTENKYINGQIYVLKCSASDKIYIGGTYHSLKIAHESHNSDFTRYCLSSGKRAKLPYFELFQSGDVSIELIEKYPCDDNVMFNRRKAYWIKHFGDKVLYGRISGRTKEEYKEDNKDKIKEDRRANYIKHKDKKAEYAKKYNQENKVKNLERKQKYRAEQKQKQMHECACGGQCIPTEWHQKRHNTTKMHVDYINTVI